MHLLALAMLAALALTATIVPRDAAAQAGETEYAGTHSGGGSIRFTVSASGTRITSLTVTGLRGGGCTWEPLGLDTWGVIEIRDNAFSTTNTDGDTIAGAFPAPFRAEGIVQVVDPASNCTSGPLRWTATAPEPARAAPPPRAPAPQPAPPPGVSPAPALGVRDAPFCGPAQQPSFHPQLAALKQRLGDTMGVVLECEHLNNANGDTLQQTTTGLAYFRWATGLPTFTDGWRHWALAGDDLIVWEGESPDPPATR